VPIIRIENPETFVGLDEVRARMEVSDHGYDCRVVFRRDGRTIHFDLRPDYDPLRVNLHVTAGKVTKATIG
jgi:hypothetical protein